MCCSCGIIAGAGGSDSGVEIETTGTSNNKYDLVPAGDRITYTIDISTPEGSEGYLKGIIEIDDPNFGNCWSNIPVAEMFENGFSYGDDVAITVTKDGKKLYDQITRFGKTFGDVKKGEAILYNNELMNVSLALSQGSFMEKYKVYFGPEYIIEIRKVK